MAVPSFDSVPDQWKHPMGPYRQAPKQYGGRWWLVTPFTAPGGIMPWVLASGEADPEPEKLPEGFVEIFGRRPKSQDFHDFPNPSQAFRVAVVTWEQDKKFFKRAGLPDWAEEDMQLVRNARAVFDAWGMGNPAFYEGRYGWMVRFPQSQIRDYQSTAWGALNATHLVIAGYQVRLINEGIIPADRHPFVPPWFFDEAEVTPAGAEAGKPATRKRKK